MADVHIIGAGPAGSIAAINAIRAGYNVHVSERHPRAGIPQNCSGLFSKTGLETLKNYVDYKKFRINDICGANIHFNDFVFRLRAKNTVAVLCDRAEFDKALAEEAAKEGAKISYNERINGKFKAKNIIGADGANSSVAKHFDFPRIGRFVGTLQKRIDYKPEEKDIVEVFLSSKIPGFFGWIIPHDEYNAERGLGVELPNSVRDAWNYLLKRKGINAENPSGSIIPVWMRPRTGRKISNKNVILVGDAAGQTKATTGGGVLFGSWCAEIAGKNIEKPAWYDIEWRARYGYELMLHRKIRDYLNNMDDTRLREFGEKLNKLNLNSYLEKYGDMDKPTKMIKPQILSYLLNIVPGFSMH